MLARLPSHVESCAKATRDRMAMQLIGHLEKEKLS